MNTNDQWHLGEEAEEPREELKPEPPLSRAPTVSNLSRDRLTRPVYVVTAELLGWSLVAVYALMTRVIALGARPLDPDEARRALAALAIAKHGLVGAHGSWITTLQGWIFTELGAHDATARIVVALCGLLLVASAFAMRPYLGRAGALAFAAMLTLSPSVTYFSRSGSTVIASAAFMVIALVIVAAIVAIAIWLPLTTAFFTRPLLEPLRSDQTAAFISPAAGLHHGMH